MYLSINHTRQGSTGILTVLLAILLLGMIIINGTATAQIAVPPDSAQGRLRTFEKALSDGDTLDTADQQHHQRCEEDDTTGNFWGEVLFFLPREIFKACAETYAGLPGPNYGPYPYCFRSPFSASYHPSPASYLELDGGFQYTYRDIPTYETRMNYFTHSFVAALSYQQFRETVSGGQNSLHLAAVKLGVRKAVGDQLIWQNHLGWRYLKGGTGMSGVLLGTQFKIFTLNRIAVTLGYDIDLFPDNGTAFHELDGWLSYYWKRLELKAGYQAQLIWQGPSLHGPSIGLAYNL